MMFQREDIRRNLGTKSEEARYVGTSSNRWNISNFQPQFDLLNVYPIRVATSENKTEKHRVRG